MRYYLVSVIEVYTDINKNSWIIAADIFWKYFELLSRCRHSLENWYFDLFVPEISVVQFPTWRTKIFYYENVNLIYIIRPSPYVLWNECESCSCPSMYRISFYGCFVFNRWTTKVGTDLGYLKMWNTSPFHTEVVILTSNRINMDEMWILVIYCKKFYYS